MVSTVMVPVIPKVDTDRVLRMQATFAVVCELAPCGALKSDHYVQGYRRAHKISLPTSPFRSRPREISTVCSGAQRLREHIRKGSSGGSKTPPPPAESAMPPVRFIHLHPRSYTGGFGRGGRGTNGDTVNQDTSVFEAESSPPLSDGLIIVDSAQTAGR